MMRIYGLSFISAILISGCIYGIHTAASGKTATKRATSVGTEGNSQCSLSNLKKIINKTNFAIAGKRSDCKFFYFTGNDISKKGFELDLNINITNPICGIPYRPMFYSKSSTSDYLLLTASESNLYLLENLWKQTNSGYYECPFTINGSETINLNILGLSHSTPNFLTNDPSTNNVHMIFRSSSYDYLDYTYSLEHRKFINNQTLQFNVGMPAAYDADLKRLYYDEGGTIMCVTASEKSGLLTYGKDSTATVLRMRGGRTLAFSVSGKYYISKEKTADQDFMFIVGSLDNSTGPACIAKSKDYGLVMDLYVDFGQNSVYRKLIKTVDPEKMATVAPLFSPVVTPKSSSSSSVLPSLFLFVLPLLFNLNN